MADPNGIFTYAGLGDFLAKVASETRIIPLRDWDGDPALILRHDVDLSIDSAARMAELEMTCGVRSTFFIMGTNEWYNPASPQNRRTLQKMVQDGFEIGLHFDVLAVPDENPAEARRRLELEAEVLSAASGAKIGSVSLHNPSISGQYPLFEGYINAYDPRFFGPGRYASDSCMLFREDLEALATRGKDETVQLLLHPLHYSPSGGGYDQIFSDMMLKLFHAVDAEWCQNVTYSQTLERGLLTSFLERLQSDKR